MQTFSCHHCHVAVKDFSWFGFVLMCVIEDVSVVMEWNDNGLLKIGTILCL